MSSSRSRRRHYRRRRRRTARRVRLYVQAGMAAVLLAGFTAMPAVAAAPTGPDPIEVRPSWSDLPGQNKILMLLDVASEVGLACCIAAIVIGGAAMGLGRLSGSMQGGSRGSGMVLAGGGGAVIIILAPKLVQWLVG